MKRLKFKAKEYPAGIEVRNAMVVHILEVTPGKVKVRWQVGGGEWTTQELPEGDTLTGHLKLAEKGATVSNVSERCALCGRDPASGFAKIGDKRYCHGDFEPDPTCYMKAQWARSKGKL